MPGKSHGQKSLASYIVHGVARVDHNLVTEKKNNTTWMNLENIMFREMSQSQKSDTV